MPLEPKYRPITIERKSGGGLNPISWASVGVATDKGFIQPTSGNENFETGKAGERVSYRMFAPMDNTNVQYGDRITQDSIKYFVIFSIQPKGVSSQSHHKEILMSLFK